MILGQLHYLCYLQAPSTARLKLCANSTRKARWDSKIGYQPDPRPFSLALSSLLAGGGTVPAVDVVVVRVYPKMVKMYSWKIVWDQLTESISNLIAGGFFV